MKKLYIKTMILLLGLSAFTSCIDDAEFVEVDDLGAPVKEYTIATDGGSIEIPVYTNKLTSANFIGECDWAILKNSEINSDGSFFVEYDANTSYPRHAKIEFVTATRRDTCVLMQHGQLEESFTVDKYVITSYGEQPEEIAVSIASENTQYSCTVKYIDGEEWVSVEIHDGKMIMTPSKNTDGQIRSAELLISWTDGWGRLQEKTLVYRQTPDGISSIDVTSFQDVRALVAAGRRLTVRDDLLIEGYVVNGKGENVGECHMEVMDNVDYDSNETTVYFEDANAEYGFRLICTSPQANTFIQYTKVQILLKGSTIQMYDGPERYDITGITPDMILSSVYVGKEGMPHKAPKYINELTPSDLYTYVTIKDCEFPIRKGSLTPVNEGYTRAFSANKIGKYPTLVRDINGSSLYMYTNMTCSYRRDGSRLPYGSGTISGVLVHEDFQPFGDMGDYQIRHLSREDIALAESMDDSFSSLLTEYRFIKEADMNTESGAITPTYGDNGWLTHTTVNFNENENPFDPTQRNHLKMTPTTDYSYLGPCVKSEAGKTTNGFGVVLEDGTDYGVVLPFANTAITANADGKGGSFQTMAWHSGQWTKKHASGKCNGWAVCFSTKDIATDKLSVQVSMYNSAAGAPKKWSAEYLVPAAGETLDDVWGASWTAVKEFTIPDVVSWSNTLLTQSPGFKPVDIPLPADLLSGLETIYFRIIPDKTVSSGSNAMNYFAVRYNR